jgi:hypothetical protein
MANEPKHTKTPWHVENLFVRCEMKFDIGTGWPIIADCNQTDVLTASEKEANAEFICRAVNAHAYLLESLKKLKNIVTGILSIAEPEIREAVGNSNVEIIFDDISSASMAIAKAEADYELAFCPVHDRLHSIGKLDPLDNCAACIRNQRNELLEQKDETAQLLNCLAQILDVVKGEWGESWSEFDQEQRDKISKWLKSFYESKHE